jgi:LCP family protein required for cell wall assembly
MKNDDSGRKPYRTYHGGSGRRRSLDDELAGLRPPRRDEGRRPAPSSAQAAPRDANGAAGDRPYHRYVAGGGAAGTAGSGDAAASSAVYHAAPPARRRRFRWWHVPLALLTLLVLAGVVITVLTYPGYRRFDDAVQRSNTRLGAAARRPLTPDEGMLLRNPTTLLVLGTDSREGEPARSDTIMLLRFDPGKHTVNYLSIPRDTRVDVPGRGTMKINEAMFWGGPALAIKVVKAYLGIPVNHVMAVNFRGFPRVVNAVGGIDMFVPETISTSPSRGGRAMTFKKGWQHFNGDDAMLYVRIRYADDDFHRAERQQRFVQALQKKIARPSNLTKLPEVGRRFMSGVETDLTTNELLELAWVKWRADDKKSRRDVLVGTPAYIGGVAYVLPPSATKKDRIIGRFLGD